LTDMRLDREGGWDNGLDLIGWVKEQKQGIPTIVLTAHGTVDTAVEAMKRGAFDYLTKPFERTELTRCIRKALLTFQFNCRMGTSQGPFTGKSAKIQKVNSIVEKVANSQTTVLILGESGTGKELVAQSIHEKSHRVKGPYIKISCAALPT